MTDSDHAYPYLKNTMKPQQIHDHPFNNSPTKMQYSFPHANRFSGLNNKNTSNVPFYEINGSFLKNSHVCSLGKGNKYDFTKNCKDTPSPNLYFPKNMLIGSEKKGFSFGISRDKIPANGMLDPSKHGKNKPGPGAYTPIFPKSGATVTFRIKPDLNNKENPQVGPGKYNIHPSFEPCKTIFNSQYRSTQGTKFPPLRSESSGVFSKKKLNESTSKDQLDQLLCDMTHQINQKGVFFNSKYQNSRCRTFSKADRDKKLKQVNNPGPGAYVTPSEFGLYASSRVK